jgi:cytidyltransferase-like protein
LGQVVSEEQILRDRRLWAGAGKRVILVVGCFDLLHPGHIRLLEEARSHADVVIVGVFRENLADANLKGSNLHSSVTVKSPIMPAAERAEVLAALAAVDYVFEIEATDLAQLLLELRPDAIVEGADPSSKVAPIPSPARASGIEVIRIPLEPGHSSSRLIERVIQLRA